MVHGHLMNLVCKKEINLKIFRKIFFCEKIGVNLTSEGDTGQLDAYVKNGEWDLEGIKKKGEILLII